MSIRESGRDSGGLSCLAYKLQPKRNTMYRLRFGLLLLSIPSLSGCGVFESAQPSLNARERDYFSTEYGNAAQSLVAVQINGQSRDFEVRLGTQHARILVEATPAAVEATTAYASKLTMGFVDRPPDQAPYREAAIRYLADSGKTGCELKSGGQIAHNRFEWRFECATSPVAAPSR